MRVDLVLKFDGNLCGVVKWILLFCCVCFPEIPVAGESRSSLIVITGRWRTTSGRDGCPERDFFGMRHGYGREVPIGNSGTKGDGVTFPVCRDEESGSQGYRCPAYPGDDGEGYERVG